MYSALSPGAIGVSARSLGEIINAARAGGFRGVEVDIREIADLVENQGADAVRSTVEQAGLRIAGWGLPNGWRGSDTEWQTLIEEFPRLVQAAAEVGATRTFTWILPFSDDMPYDANWQWHVERLTPLANVLNQHGCSLGLEFVGPKTMREGKRHEFVYTLDGMLKLGEAIGPNIGVLLDCWHWYTTHGSLEDIRALRPEQVVYVHVNDAPAGIDVDSQVDNVRALPGETGVIDIAGFLGALRDIGYDGPVVPEPFKKELRDLPDDHARLVTLGTAMRTIFERAGLSES